MKKRWINLYVENEPGVLALIAGLFSGKSYNLESLTVGPAEDETVSRMTIGLTSDDQTFEQIKKQLARRVEVIKVVDLTETATHCEELMFLRIHDCSEDDIRELFRMASVFHASVIDYSPSSHQPDAETVSEPDLLPPRRQRRHTGSEPLGLMQLFTNAELLIHRAMRPAADLFFLFRRPLLPDMEGGDRQAADHEEAIEADTPA